MLPVLMVLLVAENLSVGMPHILYNEMISSMVIFAFTFIKNPPFSHIKGACGKLEINALPSWFSMILTDGVASKVIM